MVDYDPFAEDVRKDPYPVYRRLRDEAPAYYLPKYDAWALSRFQDVWDASSDPESYSTAKGVSPAQVLTKEQPVTPMLNTLDPPAHTQLRTVIRQCFLPKHLRSLEPVARKLFEDLLDQAIARGNSCDLVGDLGSQLSVRVACMAIGLPASDATYLNRLVQAFFHHDPDTQGMSPEGLSALQELTDYCLYRIRECRRKPQDRAEAIHALARFELDGRRFSDEDAASHVTMLVIGGSETFPKTLANAAVRLWQNPDQRRECARNPSLVPDAYNESVRFDMPTQFLCRTLKRDVELHGQKLRKGQSAMFLYASANHDEREFPNPDVFDIHRRPPRILSFGAGTHQCLGTHVARFEGRITLETILKRIPEYEVDLENAVRLRTEFVQGFAHLPIRF
jgi:cytochrome P450